MVGDTPGKEDGEKNQKGPQELNRCIAVCYLLASLLIQSHHVYTKRITSVSLEFGLSHRDLGGCAMAEQNLFGFVCNIQVKGLHLVKSLHKNQKGAWISGCIAAFFPPPPFKQQQEVTHEESLSQET